jgi:hypothetical protein
VALVLLALVVLGSAVVVVLLADRTDEPLLTREGEPGQVYRVEGTLRGDPELWRLPGSGQDTGGGVVVVLDDGGEALLLAEEGAVDDLRRAVADADDSRISVLGRVTAGVTPEQVTYYGFRLDDFPPVAGGRVLVLVEDTG